jgi:hypothetical protein
VVFPEEGVVTVSGRPQKKKTLGGLSEHRGTLVCGA